MENMEKWRTLRNGEHGKHGEHGKDGKHQPYDFKYSFFLQNTLIVTFKKRLFGNQMTQNTLFYGFITYALGELDSGSAHNGKTSSEKQSPDAIKDDFTFRIILMLCQNPENMSTQHKKNQLDLESNQMKKVLKTNPWKNTQKDLLLAN